MDASSPLPELPQESIEDVLELTKDLEIIIDAVENMSVQLTWMGYDMVAVRTSPELGVSMQKLEEAFHRCKAFICGDQEPTATTPTRM
ncbi:synaptonemal complex central element protein 3 [Centropristis striata]|uniref:synaptonemal complex central element protein 3 n=1 Tax=Centropristis striata TaxID=184440 RepID=UPI0027E06D2D|nr:synaptonemal complex central element protein 3 [Centropristis striata]